jgi:hypothetical protein
MPIRWLGKRDTGTAYSCCVVLLLGALLWYATTALALWMLLALHRAGEVSWFAVALLTPAVLLALLPFVALAFRHFRGAPAESAPPPPALPTVPRARPAELTPYGPRYRLRRFTPYGLGTVGIAWGIAAGVVALAGPFAAVGHLAGPLGWQGGWLRALYFLGLAAIWFTLPGVVILTGARLARFLWFRVLLGAVLGRRAPTATLELTAYPLRPGQRCALHLLQPGNGAYASFRVRLVCVEEVTIREGKTERTESERVRDLELFRRAGLSIPHDLPLEATIDLEVPAGALHSFETPNHKVSWQLVVNLEPEGRTLDEQCFPVIVYPPEAVGGSS